MTASYKCPICRDGGLVHPRLTSGKADYSRAVPCPCSLQAREEQRQQQLLKYCELPPEGRRMTFERFKLTPALREACAACRALAEERNGGRWITLISGTGRGKTHLAVAVCNRWLARGRPAKYIYVPLLMKELRDGFGQTGDESYRSRYNTFLQAPLLVMDDLGVENRTPWVQEHLDTIVDFRLMRALPTVVTTNCKLNDIPPRIASRLRRGGDILMIDAPEYRYTGQSAPGGGDFA